MIYKETQKKIDKLKEKGYEENVDFRIVYFGNKFEVKMIRK